MSMFIANMFIWVYWWISTSAKFHFIDLEGMRKEYETLKIILLID